MKRTAILTLAVICLASPAVALDLPADCVRDPVAAEIALGVEAKLPVSLLGPDQQVPDTFYVRLTCVLLDNGYDRQEIEAMPPPMLINAAANLLTQDRSRADALLAILEAMKQAKLVPPLPEPEPAKP